MQTCETEHKERFDNLLTKNKIFLLSMPNCRACEMAKTLLKDNKIGFETVDITLDEDLFNCVYEKTKSQYVPQIFVNKKYIGSYNELGYLHKSGLLEDLLKSNI